LIAPIRKAAYFNLVIISCNDRLSRVLLRHGIIIPA